VEFNAERSGDFQNGSEGRVTFAGKSFVEAFAGEAGVASDLSHSFRHLPQSL